MEQVLKNTVSFIEVLGMSRTSHLQEWDTQALSRAFQWADYFENVYEKFLSRPKYKEQLCFELEKQSLQLASRLGCRVLRFEDLKQARQMLARSILQNIWCSAEIYTETIKQYYLKCSMEQAPLLLSIDLQNMIKMQEISKKIVAIGNEILNAKDIVYLEHFVECSGEASEKRQQDRNTNIEDAAKFTDANTSLSVETGARLLKNMILSKSKRKESKREWIAKLDAIVSSEKGVALIMLAAVHLSCDGDAESMLLITQYIKENLFKNGTGCWERFLSLPAKVIIEMVLHSKELTQFYLETLFACCECYDQQIIEEEDYLISSLKCKKRKISKQEQLKANLHKHFAELGKTNQRDISLLLKCKQNFRQNNGKSTAENQGCWEQLWDQYVIADSPVF
ncbi:uncharacterized protein LOC135686465 [Rhopilema esculentum]|uniref:uncharacterized protein LOC135686465 n=1 Tax=Rhopilema esculentum TaxID=499914 RepID=UPI0031D0ECE2